MPDRLDSAPEPLVRLERVVKRYRLGATLVQALAGVDLTLPAGRVTAFVGPSGSGKSTLLHVIGGMDRADEGEVFVAGEVLHRLSPAKLTAFRRHKVGFVFQAFNLIPNLTALENVILPAEFAAMSSREARARAVELLERVGLGGRLRHRPGELSGGEQQRVAIARALINRPALVLADEPTGNLDTRTGAAIVDLLAGLAGEETVLVATHDERIARVADRIVYLADGRLVNEEAAAGARG
ncbi:MAG: ABC transporter ATP-binding protein [Rhodospirillales bacterium]